MGEFRALCRPESREKLERLVGGDRNVASSLSLKIRGIPGNETEGWSKLRSSPNKVHSGTTLGKREHAVRPSASVAPTRSSDPKRARAVGLPGSEQPCIKVSLGVGKVANRIVLKYLKGKRYDAPYVRLACLTEEIPDGHECYVVSADSVKIKKRICMPARLLVDLIHIGITRNVSLAGKAMEVFNSSKYEKQSYELQREKVKGGSSPSSRPKGSLPNARHETCPNIAGCWGLTYYPRGGLFLAFDEWLRGDETFDLLIESRACGARHPVRDAREEDDFESRVPRVQESLARTSAQRARRPARIDQN
ncbi:hypothetical protein Q5P01_000997 [Channa striata]|uniref:Uncharacterized protein n=1 Tax=Channa striata TaxID=64152 RepID=A0AA88LM42_CHASR|nr:hypothetical protein Q5P01_000997 [Channa striata]